MPFRGKILVVEIEQLFYSGGKMAGKQDKENSLEGEIEQLRDLLKKVREKTTANLTQDEFLHVLDSVARAAPQLAALLKAQRALASEELDPAEILREALEELEKEWPELHACKESLRGGGAAAEEQEKK
jgi:hypothetical protein